MVNDDINKNWDKAKQYSKNFIQKNISITKRQSDFIEEKCLSLSKVVQKRLEEMINAS